MELPVPCDRAVQLGSVAHAGSHVRSERHHAGRCELALMNLTTVLLTLLLVSSPFARAFDRTDGTRVRCEIERNGERRVVPEEWLGHGDTGDRHPALGGAAAVVRPDKDGWPVIYFDHVTVKGIREKDPHMLDFIFYHECAHATDPARDEIEANCEAYLELDRLGLMNETLDRALAHTHRKMMRLPSRYGGSGAVFWDKTMACVSERRARPLAAGKPGQ